MLKKWTPANRNLWLNLFMAMADFVDGNGEKTLEAQLQYDYLKLFNTPEGRRIYTEAIDKGGVAELMKV